MILQYLFTGNVYKVQKVQHKLTTWAGLTRYSWQKIVNVLVCLELTKDGECVGKLTVDKKEASEMAVWVSLQLTKYNEWI